MTELKKWLLQEAETHSVRSEFMLKLFFGANVTPEINIEHLQMERYKTKSKLTQLLEMQQQLTREHKNSPHLPYWLMSVDYGIKTAEAKLSWCDRTLKILEKM